MRPAPVFITVRIALASLLLASTAASHAQAKPDVDLAVTYTAQRSLKASSTQNFWSQGGSIEAGASLWRGLGPAANLTGTHSASIGSSGVPLSLITATFGPRYRHDVKKFSFYGEALAGVAHGFNSTFPTTTNATDSANSVALQLGGGIDYAVSSHLALRALDAAWLYTQLPNGTNNTQNSLRLAAGLTYRFQKQN
jgi:opacity protein-like surface antigen